MNITISTRNSAAIEEWKRKEEGSYEDSNKSQSHVFAILNRFGGKVTLTKEEAETVLKSGSYQSTGWDDDDIRGGAKTKQIIASYCSKIRAALNNCPVS